MDSSNYTYYEGNNNSTHLQPIHLEPKSHKKTLASRVMNNTILTVYDDYPIINKPSDISIEEFYLDLLDSQPKGIGGHDVPLLHWSLARLYYTHMNKSIEQGRKSKIEVITQCIDKALKHLNKASGEYSASKYPVMHGVILLMLLHLYFTRLKLEIDSGKNGSDSSQFNRIIVQALDYGEEAYSLFKTHERETELYLCCIHIASIYLLTSFDMNNLPIHASIKSDQSITYLHKALTILQSIKLSSNNTQLPPYLNMLLNNQSNVYYEGICYYYLGLAHISHNEDDNRLAFDYLNKCIRPKYIPMCDVHWSLAHHRLGQLLSIAPYLLSQQNNVNNKINNNQLGHIPTAVNMDHLAIEVSNTHYNNALKHIDANMSGIHFDLSRNYVTQIRIALENEANIMEYINPLKYHLDSAIKGVYLVKDSYKYYYRCVILTQLYFLSSKCITSSTIVDDRIQGGMYTLEALESQSIEKNIDLHLFALNQFCHFLLDEMCTPIPTTIALMYGIRLLYCRSCMVNRAISINTQNNTRNNSINISINTHLHDSISDVTSIALHASSSLLITACCRTIGWIKKDVYISNNTMNNGLKNMNKEHFSQSPNNYRASSLVWSHETKLPPQRNLANSAPTYNRDGMNTVPVRRMQQKPVFVKTVNTPVGREKEEFVKSSLHVESIPFAPQGVRPPPPRPPMSPVPTPSSEVPIAQSEGLPHIPVGASVVPLINATTETPIVVSKRAYSTILYNAILSTGAVINTIIDSILLSFITQTPNTHIIQPKISNINASDTCLLVFATLSRTSRAEICAQSHRLHVTTGSKYLCIKNTIKSELLTKFDETIAELSALYSESIGINIHNIDDILCMNKADIKRIFKNNSKGFKYLELLHNILSIELKKNKYHAYMYVTTFLPIPSRLSYNKILNTSTLNSLFNNNNSNNNSDSKCMYESATAIDATYSGYTQYFTKNCSSSDCLLCFHVPPIQQGSVQEPILVVAIWKDSTGECMKLLKCNIDQLQLRYLIQNLVSSLSLSTRRRWSASVEALRQLSSSLSLGELLSILPNNVDALVICCPVLLRIIPWHLLYIEMSESNTTSSTKSMHHNQKIIEIQVLDKYAVCIGPNINMYEICTITTSYHGIQEDDYKMVCIDGSITNDGLYLLNDEDGPSDSQLEVSCVSSLWSDESDDVRIFDEDRAMAVNISTLAITQRIVKGTISNMLNPDDFNEELPDFDELLPIAKALYNCRILHIVAENNSINDTCYLNLYDSTQLTANKVIAQLYLRNCGLCVLSRCCVLKNITVSINDDSNVRASNPNVRASNPSVRALNPDTFTHLFDLLDSFLLAGASSVLNPLWDINLGAEANTIKLGKLSNILFLIKFYHELPKFSATKSAVAYATRSTQLWLRDSTVADIVNYVQNIPIFSIIKQKLLTELNHLSANYSDTSYTRVYNNLTDSNVDSNRECNVFGHFFYHGSFAVTGHGGDVHHPDLNADLNADLNE